MKECSEAVKLNARRALATRMGEAGRSLPDERMEGAECLASSQNEPP